MKLIACLLASIFVLACTGCVRRTVSRKGHKNPVEEKTIWIWQEEFRNKK